MGEMIRLDRYISECGECSRKQAVSIIKDGRVTVDGNTVTSPGLKVDCEAVVAALDGRELKYEKYVYYMLNKPSGCVTAVKDNLSDTVLELLKDVNKKGLFPVGRLDKDTEGLLLITNDGDLCHDLISPKKHVEKVYQVVADKSLPADAVYLFEWGMDIGDDTRCLPASLEVKGKTDRGYEYELTITEGRFHQVKRMFYALDSKVIYLKRLSIGGVMLDPKLPPGGFRRLTDDEIKLLRKSKTIE